MELGAQEWRDSLFLSYGINPPNFTDHCDVRVAAFSICHALYCKKGGLITVRHNELHDGVANFSSKAFTIIHVRDNPKTFTGCAMRGVKANTKVKGAPPKDEGELKGDLIIQDLWTQGTDIIHNMSVVNNDVISHQPQTSKKYLVADKREKKKKYLHACTNKRRHFTPFIAPVNGLLGVKAEETLKLISIRLVNT